MNNPYFALCCGSSGTTIEPAAASWQRQELHQLIFGETSLISTPERQLITEVPTTAADEPCLGFMLAAAAKLSPAPWLLLLASDARLTPGAVENLKQLCRPSQTRQLVVGRAWRLPTDQFSDGSISLDQERCNNAIATYGQLDNPSLISWILLPRHALVHVPAAIGASPEQSVGWLVDQAHIMGWPVLEASSAIPLLRPSKPKVSQGSAPEERPRCTGVVLPFKPGAPRLSLLLAAPEDQLDQLSERLAPAASLPWEVIARADLPDAFPSSTAAAWNSALADARGDLVWPLSIHLPPLALIAVLLKTFDAPWVDLVQLAWRLGDHHHPAEDPYRVEPGCLVGQRNWLQRMDGFNEQMTAREALLDLRERAQHRGASVKRLPLEFSRH